MLSVWGRLPDRLCHLVVWICTFDLVSHVAFYTNTIFLFLRQLFNKIKMIYSHGSPESLSEIKQHVVVYKVSFGQEDTI